MGRNVIIHHFLSSPFDDHPFVRDLNFLFRDSQISESTNESDLICTHFPMSYAFDLSKLTDLASRNMKKLPLIFSIDGRPCFRLSYKDSLRDSFLVPKQSFTIELPSDQFFFIDETQIPNLPQLSHQYKGFIANSNSLTPLAIMRRHIVRDSDWAHQGIFPFNNESLANTWKASLKEPAKIKNIYLPANGLKPLSILSQFLEYDIENIVFYDISAPAIQFYQTLLASWPFDDYSRFLQKQVNAGGTISEALKGSLGLSKRSWSEIEKKADAHVADAIQNSGADGAFDRLKDWMKDRNLHFETFNILEGQPSLFAGNSFFWISNILSYRPTYLHYGGASGLKQAMVPLIKAFSDLDSQTYFWGDLRPLGSGWFGEAQKLLQLIEA